MIIVIVYMQVLTVCVYIYREKYDSFIFLLHCGLKDLSFPMLIAG